MPTLMQRGATWLGARLQTAAGRSVTIVQGPRRLEAITGWVSEGAEKIVNAEAFQVSVKRFLWNFVTADLSGTVLRVGAEIVDADGSVYEVLPDDDSDAVQQLDK